MSDASDLNGNLFIDHRRHLSEAKLRVYADIENKYKKVMRIYLMNRGFDVFLHA